MRGHRPDAVMSLTVPPLLTYRRLIPRVLGGSSGFGRFLMGEVPPVRRTLFAIAAYPTHLLITLRRGGLNWGGGGVLCALEHFNGCACRAVPKVVLTVDHSLFLITDPKQLTV